MVDGVFVAAPCKINLHLRIYDRRSDGFHEIESVFQSLDFGDLVEACSLKDRSACIVQMDGELPPERNIVTKAIESFRSRSGWDAGVQVSVTKRIPMGAGLGGGSSDAASTLIALNELSGHLLGLQELRSLAEGLGSDVPFFLNRGCAFVTGRGEHVISIPSWCPWSVVLVNPMKESNTAIAYRMLDEYRLAGKLCGPEGEPMTAHGAATLLQGEPGSWPFQNDFSPVLSAEDPIYPRMLDGLRRCGAEFVSLSGSGATCFGIFSDPEEAARCAASLAMVWPFVRHVSPLRAQSV